MIVIETFVESQSNITWFVNVFISHILPEYFSGFTPVFQHVHFPTQTHFANTTARTTKLLEKSYWHLNLLVLSDKGECKFTINNCKTA
jgi:hypothetical protein